MPSFYTVEPNIFNTLADILLHTEICIISHGTSKKHTLTTKFVNHSRVESLVWSMLHVTILLPRMWKWLLEYFKIFRLLNHTVSTLSHFFFIFVLCMVLKLGRFGQQIRNTWKVLTCGAGEGWKRSVGPIM